MYTGFPSAVLVVVCVGCSSGIDACPLGNDGLGRWGEAEEAPVGVPLGDVHVHQVEDVSRIGVDSLACDGLPPFLLFFVTAEGGAFALQGAHGCFMRSRAVWVAAAVLYGYAFWSTRSLVNVHAAAGVRVQATCAGWPGDTV